MKFTLNIVLIFFGLTYLSAQKTVQLKGKVLDFHDKVPLANTLVEIDNQSATTDEQGRFIFKGLKKGTLILTANHPDCEVFSEEITLSKDQEIIITLEHHIADIENVTIHGSHKNKSSIILKTLDKI